MRKIFGFLSTAVLLVMAACTPKVDPAVQAVDNYLKALVAQDGTQISNLSCMEWEMDALLEMDSFQAVKPTLEGVSCAVTNQDGVTAIVKCAGKIITTYDTEVREFDLSERSYKVVQENGEWRVCGYQ